MRCEICGKDIISINRHMKTHGLTIGEYLKQYPLEDAAKCSNNKLAANSERKLTDKEILIQKKYKETRYKKPRKYDKEELLEIIKKFHIEHGSWPKTPDLQDKIGSIRTCFGSILAAKFEAKYGEPITGWVSPPQMGKMLRVSKGTVHNLIESGDLEVRKVGKYSFVRVDNYGR